MAPTQLDITTKALGRLVKEYRFYQEDLMNQQKHVQVLRDQNHDEYEIRKQEEVEQDTHRVIFEVLKKIKEMSTKLSDIVSTMETIPTETTQILELAKQFE